MYSPDNQPPPPGTRHHRMQVLLHCGSAARHERSKQQKKEKQACPSLPSSLPTHHQPASQSHTSTEYLHLACVQKSRLHAHPTSPPVSCILQRACVLALVPCHISGCPYPSIQLAIQPRMHARTHARPATAVISVSAHVHTYYVHRDGKHIARNQHTLPTSLPQNAATPIPPAQPGEVAATQRLPCLCVVDNKLISPEREERDLQGGRAKPKTTDQGPKEPNRGVGMGWDGLCCLSSSLRSGGTREMRNWLARRLFAPRWREP